MAFQNPYSARLQEFSAFAFNDQDPTSRQGRWKDLFASRIGRAPSRIVLEVGCSNAEFLTELASRNPEIGFLGIDWKFKVIYKAARRVERLGLKNVVLVRGVAQDIVRAVEPAGLDELWVFFPDPWAKKPQMKHRLLQEKFLLDCNRALKPGGAVYVKTDHPGYFQWVCSLLGQSVSSLPEYEAPGTPTERSRRARQVWMRRLEDPADMPPASSALCQAFEVRNVDLDYWGALSEDAPAPRPPTLFSETRTLFEKQFVDQKLPIYYLELHKK